MSLKIQNENNFLKSHHCVGNIKKIISKQNLKNFNEENNSENNRYNWSDRNEFSDW